MRREGINNLDNCKDFALAYISAISQPFTTGGVGPIRAGMAERAAAAKAAAADHSAH